MQGILHDGPNCQGAYEGCMVTSVASDMSGREQIHSVHASNRDAINWISENAVAGRFYFTKPVFWANTAAAAVDIAA